MCNDYEQHIAYAQYCQLMQELEWQIPTQQSALDLRQADDIRIGDTGSVIRVAGNSVELAPMKFGFPNPGKGPIFNFVSERRDFTNTARCVIPASAFFEFTGKKSPKAKHRFTLNDEPFMGIAGLWRPGDGNQPDSFTMLTTAPGPDVAPVHDRQIVVLRPRQFGDWLYLTKPQTETLRHLPAGSLTVKTVRAGVDKEDNLFIA